MLGTLLPHRGNGSLRPLLQLIRTRWFPVYLIATAIYVLFRVGSFTNIPDRVTDTPTYERVAAHPVWSWRFYTGERGLTIPLFFKLFHSAEGRTVAQLVFSILAWIALAGTIAGTMRTARMRPVAFGAVLAFSLSTEVILWDTLELSESITFALTALLVAAWFLVTRRASLTRICLVLVISLLWASARDTNAYVLLVVGVLVAATLLEGAARGAKTALAVGCLAIALATIGSSDRGKRWLQPMRDVVAHRVIPYPSIREYFTDRGLDPRSDWPDGSWLNNRARNVYARFLVTHPRYFFTAPLTGRQAAATYSTPDNASSVLDPNLRIYNDNAGHRFLPIPGVLERIVFPRGLTVLWILLGSIVGVAAILTALGYAKVVWLVPAGILITTYPHILVAWHFSGIEVDRHALEAALLLRLGLLLLALICLDALWTTGFPPQLPTWPARRGAGSSRAL
jgi:hypothetical protein